MKHGKLVKADCWVQYANKVEKYWQEEVALSDSETQGPLTEVGFEVSATKNLGNYNSVKYGVSLKVPCTVPELEDTFTLAKTWVFDKMSEIDKEVMS